MSEFWTSDSSLLINGYQRSGTTRDNLSLSFNQLSSASQVVVYPKAFTEKAIQRKARSALVRLCESRRKSCSSEASGSFQFLQFGVRGERFCLFTEDQIQIWESQISYGIQNRRGNDHISYYLNDANKNAYPTLLWKHFTLFCRFVFLTFYHSDYTPV